MPVQDPNDGPQLQYTSNTDGNGSYSVIVSMNDLDYYNDGSDKWMPVGSNDVDEAQL
jgi:hypothetical protein